jgi:hypothetical protein
MTSVFADSEGSLLVKFSKRCATINLAICADIEEVKGTNSKDSLKEEDKSSSHPPYSPDLTSSDFHLSGPLKDALPGRRFVDDDEQEACLKSSEASAKSFTQPAHSLNL